MLFLDFETKGLDGGVHEIGVLTTYLDENDCVADDYVVKGCSIGENEMSDEIFENFICEDYMSDITQPEMAGEIPVYVWSNWHVSYLAKHAPNFVNLCKNKIIPITSAVSMNGDSFAKIGQMTVDILGREHLGNAITDAFDLYEVVKVLINEE